MSDCVFCRIVAGTEPADVVYEDERVVAFMDVNPAAEGHVLVVPRAHARTILDIDDEDAAAVMRGAARVARAIKVALEPEGFTLFQANEPAGWQDVFHLHVHVVPRWSDDSLIEPWTDVIASGERSQIAAHIRAARAD
jgi:histidine triad (HIT) family protein